MRLKGEKPTSKKPDKTPDDTFEQQLRDMNEQLLISSVRQHELAAIAEKSEESAREKELRLQFTLESAKGGDWDLDLHTGKAQCSFRHDQCFGATEPIPDWSYEKFLARVHPDDRDAEDRKFQAAVASGTDWSIDCRVVWPDGSIHWIESSGRNYRYVDGKPTRMLGMVRDITESRQAEKASAFLASIVTYSDDAILSKDLNGFITSWNKGAEHLFQYSESEMIGKPVTLLIPPDHLDEEPQILARVRRGEVIDHYETVRRRKDGMLLDISLTVSPLKDAGGTIIGATKIARDITRTKQAERALRESEQRFIKAFNASPLSITITALATGKLVEVNDTFVAVTGYSRAEAVGRTTVELGLWENASDREAELETIASAGSLRHNEYRFRLKDGSEIIGLLSAEFIEIGGEQCALTVIQDITERSNVDMALRKSEERFTRFMHHLPGLAWIKDVEGRYVYSNDAAADAFNTSIEKLYGRTDRELFEPGTADRFRENDQQAVEKGSGVQTVETLEHRDGTVHHSIVSKFPIPDADGRTALIGGMAIDITDRIQAENALRESEEKFRILSEAAPALIWFDDAEGNCLYVNQQYLDFSGKTLGELEGTGWHLFLHPEDEKEYITDFLEAQSERRAFHHRVRALRRDGAWRWIESFARPLFGSDGVYLGHVGVSPDISASVEAEIVLRRDREELEARVAERTRELSELNAALKAENAQRLRVERESVRLLQQIVTTQEDERRRIARDLHDELGQQLTALRLKLVSAKEMCDDEAVCDEIDEIQAIAAGLDEDVSFLARQLHAAALDENGLAAALDSYVRQWARFSSINAEFHTTGLSRTRFAQETETNLYRIAQEALNNANKHSRAENVSVLLEKRKDEIILIVEDDGVAFDTDVPRRRGKGLGLIGMKERATLLGGTLEIESSPGSGTTVFVRVPAVGDGEMGRKGEREKAN